MSDATRISGFASDLSRRVKALRDKPGALVLLRALDRSLQVLERDDEANDSPLACAMREAVRDIEAEERAEDEAHERARDEVVPRDDPPPIIGRPGDGVSLDPIALELDPRDSDSPAEVFGPGGERGGEGGP